MKKIFAAIQILVLSLAISVTAAADKVKEYNYAKELLSAGQYSSAAKAFRDLGSFENATLYAMYSGALAAGENGEYEAAVQNLQSLGGFMDCNLQILYYWARYYESIEDYSGAISDYKEISFFRDSQERIQSCHDAISARDYARAEELERQNRLEEARIAFLALGDYKDSKKRAGQVLEKINAGKYADAEALEKKNKLEEARDAFLALDDYSDSRQRAEHLQDAIHMRDYDSAEKMVLVGNYADAYGLYTNLKDYQDSAVRAAAIHDQAMYQKGIRAAENGNYKSAYSYFKELGTYEDSERKAYIFGIADFAEQTKPLGNMMFAYRMHGVWGMANWSEDIIRAARWDEIGGYQDNGLAIIKLNGKIGLLNLNGDVTVEPQYASLESFGKNGLAKAGMDGKFGYIDASGTVVVPFRYQELEPYKADGLAKAKRDGGYGYVNENGKEAVLCKYETLDDFDWKGFAKAKAKNGYGYVNWEGMETVPCKYQELGSFGSNDLAEAKCNGLYGYVNRRGEEVLPCEYARVSDFFDGVCTVARRAEKGFFFGLMAEDGSIVSEAQWRTLDDSYNAKGSSSAQISAPLYPAGFAFAEDTEGKWTLLTARGEELCSERWDEFTHFDGNLMAVRRGTRWGFIDKQGAVVAEPVYTKVASFKEDACAVQRNGHWGYIDRAGQEIIPPVYESAKDFASGQADVYVKDDGWRIIGKDGVKVFPVDGSFQKGMALLAENRYEEAAAAFARAGDAQMESEARYRLADEVRKGGDLQGARAIFEALGDYGDSNARAEETYYAQAEQLLALKDYDGAVTAFNRAGSYSDAKERILKTRYAQGEALLVAEDYDSAIAAFKTAGTYSDAKEKITECIYQKASTQAEQGQKQEAYELYLSIVEYKDVVEKITGDPELLALALEATDGFARTGDAQMESKARYYLADELRKGGNLQDARVIFETLGDYGDSKVRTEEIYYAQAEQLLAGKEYDAAIQSFLKAGNYSDAPERIQAAHYQKGESLLASSDFDGAADCFEQAGGYSDAKERILKTRYAQGELLLVALDYDEAVKAFEKAGEYSDAKERILKTHYAQGESLLASEDYDGAITAFTQAGSHSNAKEKITECIYRKAGTLAAGKQKQEAYDLYLSIIEFKDVVEKITGDPELLALAMEAAEATEAAAAEEAREAKLKPYRTVGSTVTFGTYPQTSSGTDNTPIEWIVLDTDGKKSLLISKYALDTKPYNTQYTSVTWETCTLRSWLNKVFLGKAFSSAEQGAILTTNVDNSKAQGYSGYNTNGGNNTQDKIFLLSYAEAWKYFKDDDARKCAPTDYAIKQGAYTSSSNKADGRATGWWWLRSPGYSQSDATNVLDDGSRISNFVNYTNRVVRPAFWLNLESGIFESEIKTEEIRFPQKLREALPKAAYEEAEKLLFAGEYEKATELFESAGDYSDAIERILKTHYAQGEALLAAEDYDGAITAFTQAGSYSDAKEKITECTYHKAGALAEKGQNQKAYDLYLSIIEYKDVVEKITGDPELLNLAMKAAEAAEAEAAAHEAKRKLSETIGSSITFGTYPQSSSGTDQTPIEWIVLDTDGKKSLLISKYALDAKPYNTADKNVIWETCALRTWLNQEFLGKAFSSTEQSAILTTNVDNSKAQGCSVYNTNGGNNTQDKIFLLSYSEAWKFFKDDNARMCAPTDYAIRQGAWTSSDNMVDGKAAGAWWLRSPGYNQNYATYVNNVGSRGSSYVDSTSSIVRPAFWLNLESEMKSDENPIPQKLQEALSKEAYERAEKLLSAGDYEKAVELFIIAGGYSDAKEKITECIYQKAGTLAEQGQKQEACELYLSIAEYKDAVEKITEDPELLTLAIEAAETAKAAEAKEKSYKTIGGKVTFGTYPQTSSGTDQTPIEWIVLDTDGKKSLLISRYGLDAKPFNKAEKNVIWETSTLRTWLNQEFLEKAFSSTEQSAILTTNVDNSKAQGYSGYNTNGGNNTQDKIFLLSYAEAWKYFKDDDARKCAPTDYAIKQGAYTSSSNKADGRATGWWWLRSPGYDQSSAARVDIGGSRGGSDVNYAHSVVRPAFWLNLESGIFESEIKTEEIRFPQKLREALPRAAYDMAEKLFSARDYDGAAEYFESAGEYSDAKERILKTRYAQGEKLFSAGDYNGAIQAFEQAGSWSDAPEKKKEAQYRKANALREASQTAAAAQIYAQIREYADVETILKKDKALDAAVHDAVTAPYRKVGNIVTLGTYPQTSEGNDQTPIEWIVLDTDGKKSLLISRYGLDAKPYHEKKTDITWDKCTLRGWLNKDFLKAAFTPAQQKAVLTTSVDNSKTQGYSGYDTKGGSNTKDKVFLLSYAEAWTYFKDDNARKCAPTDYAIKQGAYTSSSNKADGRATGYWWLRSPGRNQDDATDVFSDGSRGGGSVHNTLNVVRPAFWLNLESGIF